MKKEKKKILILVKTYPVLSKKYSELVCTAGITEEGSWIRIYPVPFRFLEYEKKYSKFQWIEAEVIKNISDPRPESYKIADIKTIKLLDTIDTKNGWRKRKDLLFKNLIVFDNTNELIKKANKNELSLALFKPAKILDFIVEKADSEWDKEIAGKIRNDIKQPDLFSTEEERLAKENFQLVKKIPYKFSYKFQDSSGKESILMIEDWEIGQLYWNCLKRASGDEKTAVEQVKNKYLNEFQKKDIYLFLGTARRFHGWARNPFLIIGVFYPPKTEKYNLFN
ncbi:MAG: hypothetical protein COT16_01610 [Elusimicrobia bacterium CG08_land_8_20_14_0_20_44_26]|nr:MAG: hypothetical protein COT16_01610 [Elusimicrobia bacterium CG08_land_8_20_14_0_20_44_26]